MRNVWISLAAVAVWTAAVVDAQTITPLVIEGDVVPGVGNVTTIGNIAVNADGVWLVEADTDAGSDVDSVLIRDGVLVLREGDPLPSPPGAILDSFDSVTIDDEGDAGFNFFLDGTAGGGDDSGVYSGTGSNPVTLMLQEGSDDPGVPGTPIIGFFDVKPTGGDTYLVIASVDDPAVTSSVDRAMYLWTTDPATGGVEVNTRILLEGDVLPGQTDGLTDVGTSPHESAINASGEVFFSVDIPTGDAIYRYDAGAFTEVAREGQPSPVPGRNWDSLTSIALDINASGQTVLRADIDGDTATDKVIVRDGVVLRQEGDAPPGFPSFAITSFGTGPVEIDDTGRVLWYADWDDPDTDIDSALFLDDTLLVQEGVTEINGLVVDTLRGVEDGYHMSSDGQFIVIEAILAGGVDGAFLIALDPGSGDVFRRGDSNNDGTVNIADAIYSANSLFVTGSPPPECSDAADANDDGQFNIADVIWTANFLFVMGSPPPPSPFPGCGTDGTADALDCPAFVGLGC